MPDETIVYFISEAIEGFTIRHKIWLTIFGLIGTLSAISTIGLIIFQRVREILDDWESTLTFICFSIMLISGVGIIGNVFWLWELRYYPESYLLSVM